LTFRSGFVTVVGRPNVGKSTLVNCLVGTKVAITSTRPQTTRSEIRGVRTDPGRSQIVFLDTPGVHKPRTALGERTNQRALATLAEVDVICHLVEATAAIGPGDRFVAERVHHVDTAAVLVVNKTDRAGKAEIAGRLAAGAEQLGDYDAFVPVSAKTGDGTDALLGEIEARLPEGPAYYPEGVVTDQPETFLAAELLREQLIRATHDELPHAITVACEVDDEDDARPDLVRLRATIGVERESQKGIVIGRGGSVLKAAGSEARRELEALLGTRVHLETRVRVERDWQRRPAALDRLGY
jgi:GTP-binding protein Era